MWYINLLSKIQLWVYKGEHFSWFDFVMDLFDEIMNRGPGFLYLISGKALLKIHKKHICSCCICFLVYLQLMLFILVSQSTLRFKMHGYRILSGSDGLRKLFFCLLSSVISLHILYCAVCCINAESLLHWNKIFTLNIFSSSPVRQVSL